MYPHHRRYQRKQCARRHDDEIDLEPSAREFILAERYVMGPPTKRDDEYYTSDFGQVFYERNIWPNDQLETLMTHFYDELYDCSIAVARVLAAALGAHYTAFDALISPERHHSRFQINHYPCVRFDTDVTPPFRANAHHDTAIFTLLVRPTDIGGPGSLEIRDDTTGEWRYVPGAKVTCQLGSLIEYLTNGVVTAATHRVRRPPKNRNLRRLSYGFVLKPDYTAPAAPPPLLDAVLPVHHGDVPPLGFIGRVGWQSHAMLQNPSLDKDHAKALFKRWKLTMRQDRGFTRRRDSDPPDAPSSSSDLIVL